MFLIASMNLSPNNDIGAVDLENNPSTSNRYSSLRGINYSVKIKSDVENTTASAQPSCYRFNDCPTHQQTKDVDISFIITNFLDQQPVTAEHLACFGVPEADKPSAEAALNKQWFFIFKHWQSRTGGDMTELSFSLKGYGFHQLEQQISRYMSSEDKLAYRVSYKNELN